MREGGEYSLTAFQSGVLLIISAGFGVIVPSDSFSGSMLAAKLLSAALFALPLVCVVKVFSDKGYYSLTCALNGLFSKPASKGLFALLGLYFSLQAVLRLANGCKLINLFLLPATPKEAVLLAIAVTASALFYAGLRRLGAMGELVFMLLLLPILFLLVIAFAQLDRVKLMELSYTEGLTSAGIISGARSFHGMGAFLFWLGVGRSEKKSGRWIFYAYLLTAFFSIAAFIVCVGMFTVRGAGVLLYPINEVYRVLSIGSLTLSERYDMLFLLIQLISVIMGASVLMYCACVSFASSCGLRSHRSWVLLMLPVVFYFSYVMSQGHLKALTGAADAGFLVLMLGVLPLIALKGRSKG